MMPKFESVALMEVQYGVERDGRHEPQTIAVATGGMQGLVWRTGCSLKEQEVDGMIMKKPKNWTRTSPHREMNYQAPPPAQ